MKLTISNWHRNGFRVAMFLLLAPLGLGQEDAPPRVEDAGPRMDCRWFFSFGYGRNRDDVDKIKALIDTGAAHGLNGMVLSSFGLDSITRWKKQDFALLREVADHCADKGMELIPTGFSAGYGGGVLGHDRSFAAALPTTISLRATDGRIVPDTNRNLLVNGGLENHTGDRFKGFAFIDQPGEISFADPEAAAGQVAIRFENFGANEHGHGRMMQEVAVQPGRAYRFSCRIRTRDLEPVSGLKAMVLGDGRSLASLQPIVKRTQDWTEITMDYLNKDEETVKVYAGIWGGKSGTFWLDDLTFSEFGDLSDIVRRKGTPLRLGSRDRDNVFVEGRDYAEIRCLRQLDALRLPPGSTVQEGERLELSCYKIPTVSHSWGEQVSLCMSNPALYEYWGKQAEKLHEVIQFKRYLLAMDEIRNGGGCLTCRERQLSMAAILGDCMTRQRAIFKAIDPRIEVLTWSDMLDPAHNARDDYYGVVGDFTGAWKHVPEDLTIMCWYHKIRDRSLGFFAGHGFRTMGAAYYDADDLTNPREWLHSLERTPKAAGIMYTSWERKYELLGAFGDLASGK